MSEIDEMINSLVCQIDLLKHERKKLNKQMTENRQQTAEARNMLRRLKERKKVTE